MQISKIAYSAAKKLSNYEASQVGVKSANIKAHWHDTVLNSTDNIRDGVIYRVLKKDTLIPVKELNNGPMSKPGKLNRLA